MEVTIEFSFDFSKGVSGAFIRSGLISPVGVHNEPRTVVNVVELLAHGALVGHVTTHEHEVRRHGNVRSAVTVALDDLSVTRVAGGFKTDGTVFTTNRGLVEVSDADVGALVPLFLVVFFEHESVIKAEVVPSTSGILVTSTLSTSDGIVVHDGGAVHHALQERVLVELGKIASPFRDVVRLIGVFFILVGKMNVEVTTTRKENASRGKEKSVLSATEHFFFLFSCRR